MTLLQTCNLVAALLLFATGALVALKRRGDAYSRPFLYFVLVNLAGIIAVGSETAAKTALWTAGYWALFFYIGGLPSAYLIMTRTWGRDSKSLGRAHRLLVWSALAVSAALLAFLAVTHGVDITLGDGHWFLDLHGLPLVIGAVYIAAVTAGLYSIETCYRSSIGLSREKIKRSFFPLLAYGLGLLAIATLMMLYHRAGEWMMTLTFVLAALVSIPVARHFILFDPAGDGIVLTRKGIYSSIVVVLVGVYFLIIGSVGELLVRYNLDEGIFFSLAVLSLLMLTFLILVVSQTIRFRLRVVSPQARTIGRSGIYAEEWKEFTEEVSVILNIDGIYERTQGLLHRLLKIEHGFFVIKEAAPSENFTLYSGDGIDRGIPGPRLQRLADWLYRYGRPVEVVTLADKAPQEAEELTQLQEAMPFKVFLLIPLVARQQFLGFWGVGRHTTGRDLASDEVGFIEAAANPVALTILGARMTDELVVSREIESFHRISSFVMHDLKNSVAMLSMLLQNAEKNMHHPEFQKEALVTIAKAVERQRKILSRLAEPESADRLSLGQADLAELIGRTLSRLKLDTLPTITVNCTVADGITVFVDAEKIGSVFDNLVMNALEAMPDGGTLKIRPAPSDLAGFAAVSFLDSGVGMEPEFIATRLFKPFSSTKPYGLGIGMYQSREIVKSHRGRMDVFSVPGQGTEFIIHLPGEGRN